MKTLGIVFAIIAFIACAWIFQQNAPLILSYIKDLGWLAPVLFVLLYCLATILLLPTMVLTFAGGALFGPLLGVLFNLIGATAGAACAFLLVAIWQLIGSLLAGGQRLTNSSQVLNAVAGNL
ncbi:TVP38/TMEM64 family protein [Legionella tunisiensis]|uniref:hypothetical protein n=1 Tax=Legionella tunisiensis TaxID=1034944 RepID=UPI00030E3A27|nr:hypothetical protein [Legionella tunisiensis]